MRVRMVTAYTPITSYRFLEELESVFSVQFGAIVTEQGDDVTISIPFSEYWLSISRESDKRTDDDIPPVRVVVSVARLPNNKPMFSYKSRNWIRNAKDFEREAYSLLQAVADKMGSAELDKLLIKVKKSLSKVLSKFDSSEIPSERVRTKPKALNDEEE